ncbi:MAG: ABC-2 family transporter protein [Chloroflexota bacterium]|nr:ABC-2 family transporter protein [Chloroflexota bacterium]
MGSLAEWRQELELTWRIARMRIAAQMQFQGSFLMQLFGNSIMTVMEIVTVLIFFQQFPALGGWTLDEVLMLYAMCAIAFEIADSIQNGLDLIPQQVRTGDFDRLMTRPMSVYLQAITLDISVRHIGKTLVAAGLFGWAWLRLDLTLTAETLFLLVSAWICGVALFIAIFTLGAIVSFWTVGSVEVVNAISYGGSDLAQYPIHIYRRWFRTIFIWLIPIGFVIYYPTLIILDKPDPLGFASIAPVIGPLLTLAFVMVVGLLWRQGVNHYHSTGS